MDVRIFSSPADLAIVGAQLVAQAIIEKPDAVLGLATGTSPLGVYEELARMVAEGVVDFTGVSGFALDEYVGVPADQPQSYAAVIKAAVTRPLGLDPSRVHVPDGRSVDIDAMCLAYEAEIKAAGGVDIQILGIGGNGHIGFNEPSSSFSSRTRMAALAASTRLDNARFFEDRSLVPTRCVTQGLGTIMEARRILLLAHGHGKAKAIESAVEGPVTTRCPASILQTHPDVVVLLDEAAARCLRFTERYRHVGTDAATPGRPSGAFRGRPLPIPAGIRRSSCQH